MYCKLYLKSTDFTVLKLHITSHSPPVNANMKEDKFLVQSLLAIWNLHAKLSGMETGGKFHASEEKKGGLAKCW